MSLLPGATRFLPTGYSYFNTNLRSIIVNNGLFMERFKQMTYQQEKEASLVPKPIAAASSSAACDVRKNTAAKSGSKLAFSFKQKSKLVQPAVKLDEDEDEEKNAWNTSAGGSVKSQKCGLSDSSARSAGPEVAPPSPSDNTVKKVADRLASFVAKNGRHMEHITRQRNPGDTPFKFLFDESCVDYKYYVYRLVEEEKALELAKDSQASRNGSTSSSGSSFAPSQDQTKYQTPASALCEADETIPAEAACGRSALDVCSSRDRDTSFLIAIRRDQQFPPARSHKTEGSYSTDFRVQFPSCSIRLPAIGRRLKCRIGVKFVERVPNSSIFDLKLMMCRLELYRLSYHNPKWTAVFLTNLIVYLVASI